MKPIARILAVAPAILMIATSILVPNVASASIPGLSFNFSAAEVEVNQATGASLCVAHSRVPSSLVFEEAFGTKTVWRSVFQKKIAVGSTCVSYSLEDKTLGKFLYR